MKEWMAILAQDTPATAAKQVPVTGEQSNTEIEATENGTLTSGVEDPIAGDQAPRQEVNPIWMFALMGLVFYFLMIRPNQKKQKAQKEMLGGVKKHDKIKTIGGIFGTVLDVKDDYVVLKIDETNNTKMHIARSAIGTVLEDNTKK